ncbi:MAG: SNF2-related protein, partial [Planctomycetota bacterium]
MAMTGIGQPGDASTLPPVRSFGGDAFALPRIVVAGGCDLVLPTPPALRLPVVMPAPTVTSIEPLPQRPRVQSHFFALPVAVPAAAQPPLTWAGCDPAQQGAPHRSGQGGRDAARRARIAPPKDVVKLSERFFYLLQPDLETMLRGGKLAFPRQPFPFQFEGMAFLLPRHSAVLADEMGLGKSMQAISSIRLLVRSGEARRVLVVCPKGLVSNWARELADWAPELVVAVIDGDPARRRW